MPSSLAKNASVALLSTAVTPSPEDSSYSFIFDEARRLAEKGVNLHIIRAKVGEDFDAFGLHFHDLHRKIGYASITASLRSLTSHPRSSFWRNPKKFYREARYASSAVEVIKAGKLDLIHAHFAYPEGLVGAFCKRETEKPLIITLHGYDIVVDTSVRYGIRLDKSMDYLVRFALNQADAVIGASVAVCEEAKRIVDDSHKVHLIPNGVDLGRFNPRLDGSQLRRKLGIDERPAVFSLRRHEPKYGLEYLIRAVPIIRRSLKDVVFVIGGVGPLLDIHRKLAEYLGVSDLVIFPGKIPQDELPAHYAMCNLTVVPSVQEAFGLVAAEAMACGKPIVATRVGGLPDQVIDGRNGFLVQPKSPEAIADRVVWLIEHPIEARRMGTEGRKLAEEKFDIDRRADSILNLYRTVLEPR